MLTGQEKNLIILLLGNEQIIGVETMDQELRKAREASRRENHPDAVPSAEKAGNDAGSGDGADADAEACPDLYSV